MKLGIRQMAVSGGVFCVLMMALVSVDDRVRERFSELVYGSASVSSFSDRAGTLVDALAGAVKYQSIENAPLVVFAAVGAVLLLFMLRT